MLNNNLCIKYQNWRGLNGDIICFVVWVHITFNFLLKQGQSLSFWIFSIYLNFRAGFHVEAHDEVPQSGRERSDPAEARAEVNAADSEWD